MRSLQLFPWRSEPSASLWENGEPLQFWCWRPSQSLEAAHHFGNLRYDRLVVQGQPLRDFLQILLTEPSTGSLRGFLRFVQSGEPLEWLGWSGLQREVNLFLPLAWWASAQGWEVHLRMGRAVWGKEFQSDALGRDALRELTAVPDEAGVRAWAEQVGVDYRDHRPGEEIPGKGLIWRKGERAILKPEGKTDWAIADFQNLWALRDLWPYFWAQGYRWAVVGNLVLFSPKPEGPRP